jgi:hypothetical protein
VACLYQRNNIFWVKFKTAAGWQRASTHCRVDVDADIRRARQIKAEKALAELKLPATFDAGPGWDWVPKFITVKYSQRLTTRERYAIAWQTIRVFLDLQKIHMPSQLSRGHCVDDYLPWRLDRQKLPKGVYKAGHNTALLELKILRLVMNEAVIRGFASGNPCVRLEIPKAERKLKPEFTDEHYELIRAHIRLVEDRCQREMLANSLEIARYQGCRLKETQLDPFTAVDLSRMTITFPGPKNKKPHTADLHHKLIPLFQRLREQNKTITWSNPTTNQNRQWAAATWWKFLNAAGLREKLGPNSCFHSTRVTAATRMFRAGVPLAQAKAFVNHSSTLMHELYLRPRPGDMKDAVKALD